MPTCSITGDYVHAVPITPPEPVVKITVDGSEVTLSDETIAQIRAAVGKCVELPKKLAPDERNMT